MANMGLLWFMTTVLRLIMGTAKPTGPYIGNLKVKLGLQNQIDFEFYEKPSENKKVILANSAISWNSKREILTQDCLRRLRNTKIELGEETRIKHLNEFMIKLKDSGYNRKFRIEILDSALHAFNKMVEEDKKGTKPLYRKRSWNKEEREIFWLYKKI